tara:strand:+ start:30064 stop:30588 length:525 start_codon:yes stop_codon:yes gene_type:complete
MRKADRPINQVEFQRFMRQVIKSVNGCWLFQGSGTTDGYGHHRQGPGQPREMAHKFSYRLHKGDVPDGMQVDHKCHTEAVEQEKCDGGEACTHRRCVNPNHLELVTASENTTRQAHANRMKNECPKGHEFTPENTIVWSDGKRRCRTCRTAQRHEKDGASGQRKGRKKEESANP